MIPMTITDREKISELYLQKTLISRIAKETGYSELTIRMELKRGYSGELNVNNHPAYDPHLAQQVVDERKAQRKLKKEPKPAPPRKFRHVTQADREQISALHLQDYALTHIAEITGFSPHTIRNEFIRGYTGKLNKNNCPEYDPQLAQQKVRGGSKLKLE